MRLSRLRSTMTAVVLGSVVGAAPAATAGWPLPKVKVEVPEVKDPAELWSQAMWKVNSISQEGLRELPGQIDENDDPKKVKAQLDAADKKYKEAKKYYATVPDPKSVNEGATNYYLELEAGVQNGRLAVKCLEAYKPIAKSFGEGKPVKDDLLNTFDKAAGEYKAGAIGEDGGREAERWGKQAADFREMNPKVAEMKAKGELKLQREAEQKAETDAFAAIDASFKSFDETLAADKGPIADADFATFEERVTAIEKFRPESRPYYVWKAWPYRLSNAWHNGGAAAVSELLSATLETQGELSGSEKPFKVKAAGKAGRCYAAATFWAERGSEAKYELDMIATKNVSYAHEFEVFNPGDEGQYLVGLCTNKEAPIELVGTLTYAGTSQKLRYAIVSWEREKLPEMFMGRISTFADDQADPERWMDMFMNPIPMTFFYGSGPVIGREVNGRGASRLLALDGTEGSRGSGLTAKAPDTLKFEAKWDTPPTARAWRNRCDEGAMAGPWCKKLVPCFVKVDKEFQPKWDRANEAVEKSNILTEDRLKVQRDKVDDQWGLALESRCIKPIASKIDAEMQAAYTKLVDWFNQTKPSALIDVPAKMRAWEIAVERAER